MIEVVDYDERWPRRFELLRDRYRRALAGVAVIAIEHVGSTSVPGLAAKPIIDIVVAEADVEAASAALEALGFEPLGLLDQAGLDEHERAEIELVNRRA